MSTAGVCCHCSWGGKLGGQDGPRALVGDGQPTGLAAVGELGLLDGVGLPDLMDAARPDDRRSGWLFPPRPVDGGGAEVGLEGSDGRDMLIWKFFSD
jgi:hypothetical protein